jgi:hypothetical protein
MDYYPALVKTQHLMGVPKGAKRCVMSTEISPKCLAFEGSNAGCRFYMCSMENVNTFHRFVQYSSLLFLFSELTDAFRFRFRISVSW